MKLVVGLGNPGIEYVWTRHNAGQIILSSIVEKLYLGQPKNNFQGSFWETFFEGQKIGLLFPHTFMNLSGLAVAEAVNFYKLTADDILIISDEVALSFGRIRLRKTGSAGGQKGLASILGALGTFDICRLRIGIGTPISTTEKKINLSSWVLGKFPKEQQEIFPIIQSACFDVFKLWVRGEIDLAMNLANNYRNEKTN
ncbi:MAG: aminoacyl-tRNA hydrolase [Synergistaceae bacterium]|nr:aminoacyl-tRNA hydrolase [Synergistaceae bacterium]